MPRDTIKREVEEALRPLLGLPLSAMHRSRQRPGWQRFEFGRQEVSSFAAGRSLTCGQYVIHAVCAWRVVGPEGIATGAFDYFDVDGTEQWPDFQEGDAELRSRRATELIHHVEQEDLMIQEIAADAVGSVHFAMAGGYFLDLLPIDSLPNVQWRLIDRVGNTDDFVLTGMGIERTRE